jgi:hypothetical protein
MCRRVPSRAAGYVVRSAGGFHQARVTSGHQGVKEAGRMVAQSRTTTYPAATTAHTDTKFGSGIRRSDALETCPDLPARGVGLDAALSSSMTDSSSRAACPRDRALAFLELRKRRAAGREDELANHKEWVTTDHQSRRRLEIVFRATSGHGCNHTCAVAVSTAC